MKATERLKAIATMLTWRAAERWLTIFYLAAQLLLMFVNPVASMAMGIFLIAVLLAATSF